MSQRVRSTSTTAELDQARRRMTAARRKKAAAGKDRSNPGLSRPITPKDVADRYDSANAGRPKAPSRTLTSGSSGGKSAISRPVASRGQGVKGQATQGKDVRGKGLSDQRGAIVRPAASGKTGAADKGGASSNAASNAARIKAARADAAARSAEARTLAARKKQAAADESRDVRIKNARIKRKAQDAKQASNDARIEKERQKYANRVAAARRKAMAAGGVDGAITTGGGLSVGGTASGKGGRGGPGDAVLGGVGSPIQAGERVSRGHNGGYNDGYGYGYDGYCDPYYNSCFWNYWGGNCNSWCSWFWTPFYASGICWQNYWLYGGGWGYGYGYVQRSRRYNNCIWLGPFLPYSSSIIIYDDPEPEVIIVEVPAEEEELIPAGQVVVLPDAVDAKLPAQEMLLPEATDPGLQRELNRAAAYYLTQGDRAFREARYGDSAHFYAKAVEFSADSGILYLVLSDALFATGDYRYAAYALRQAFEREPELARNVVDKREFYADPEEFDRQLATLERYVEDHVLDMDARLVLAANYLFSGRPDSAWSLLDNPFSEELRDTNAGKLIQSSAHRVMFGDEVEAAGSDE